VSELHTHIITQPIHSFKSYT